MLMLDKLAKWAKQKLFVRDILATATTMMMIIEEIKDFYPRIIVRTLAFKRLLSQSDNFPGLTNGAIILSR